jgi:hypothetical protein
MNVFVPYNKLGKKARRKIDTSKRRTWNGVDPVTRKAGDSRAYDRKKTQKGDNFPNGPFLFAFDQMTRMSAPAGSRNILITLYALYSDDLHDICLRVVFNESDDIIV